MIDANLLMPAALAYAGVMCFRLALDIREEAEFSLFDAVAGILWLFLGLGCILALLAAAWVGKPGWI